MTRLAFGGFELDPVTGELWKGEECVRIQEQPLKLLLCLLERPGQLVAREELQKRVWGGDVHVGFEDGLNAAAWRLRQVLGDSAERPLFIETVPRKGYRFLGKVLPLPGKAPPLSGSFPMPVFRPPSGSSVYPVVQGGWLRIPRKLWLGAALGLGLLGAGVMLWGVMRPKPIPLLVSPLVNVTGDPAVDYFASALSRQVTQDLAAVPKLKVQAVENIATGTEPSPAETQILTWTLARETQGYRVTVSLRDAQGGSRGDQVFLVAAEDLHDAHRSIAAYLTSRVTEGPRSMAAP
ncbi:winged helix-turn-helix domain-containing protein [Geothrix fuzhouensis]|uniref:winged helix-turn-helix domain-containing protein n=1 Tax=Geothrix fuzhouensis TaxID=2966451 RepID=UPI0021481776|nr:winged helix-turn-helix domain-containing protein [Geothrix fuzhouensis]